MRLVSMKTILLIAAIGIFPVVSQAKTTTNPDSLRDQIKASRAKDAAAAKAGPTAREWDRDVNGKRPWERIETTIK
jgi:hypothetical protein